MSLQQTGAEGGVTGELSTARDGALYVGVCAAAFKLLLHLVFSSNYGYFRDELYFLACGEHLTWGYPDHAPMVALVAKVGRDVLGDKRENAEKVCGSVEERTEVNHPLSMREEKYKILICRRTKQPLQELWPKLRVWN